MTDGDRLRADAARDAALLGWAPLARLGAGDVVALYVAVGTEPGTAALRTALAARGVVVLLPRLLADGGLAFAPDGVLVPGPRGIPEPAGPAVPLAAAAVVLVPGLAVDARGNRLGRGGGSYDRALRGRDSGAPVVCLLAAGELVDALPAEPHDAPVDAVALPTGVRPVGWTE